MSEMAMSRLVPLLEFNLSSCMYEDCGIKHYQAGHDIAKPLDQLKPADRNAVLTQICRKVRDAAAKPVRSFKEERFDKSPPERAYGSVLEDEASKGAIRWEDHLGHTSQGEPPAIMCQAIQLSGTNISGKPIRIEAARLVSKISDESVEVDIGTVDDTTDRLAIRNRGARTIRGRVRPVRPDTTDRLAIRNRGAHTIRGRVRPVRPDTIAHRAIHNHGAHTIRGRARPVR